LEYFIPTQRNHSLIFDMKQATSVRKRATSLFWMLSLIVTFFIGSILTCCTPENIPPVCTISSPDKNSYIEQGSQVIIQVNASDPDGMITGVAITVSDGTVETIFEQPYELIWSTTACPTGRYVISARATDDMDGEAADETVVYLQDTGIAPEDRGSVQDVDGNMYATIRIGSQWWMAENLRTTHYSDGMKVSYMPDSLYWSTLSPSDQGFCWYGNDSLANAAAYGALYTFAAALKGGRGSDADPSGVQGVCPEGWHIPSDSEWSRLIEFLHGDLVAGSGLKEAGTIHWDVPNEGANNSTGFTALPGGFRDSRAKFSSLGAFGFWWSTTEPQTDSSLIRSMSYMASKVTNYKVLESYGLSVRCVKD